MTSELTIDQILIAHIGKVLLLFALVGIVWRGRAHLCWSFTVYLAASLVTNVLFTFWPETFYTRWFWILQQGVDDALKVAIAIELGYRIFQAFPGAQASARRLLFLLLIATSVAIIGIPVGVSFEYLRAVFEPRVVTGTIWLMNGLALLIVWYRVPAHPFHKAILMGFVPYLVVFTSLYTLLGKYEWLLRIVQSVDPAASMLMVAFWTWAAWAPETQPDVSAAVIRFLQPWRKFPDPNQQARPSAAQALQPERA